MSQHILAVAIFALNMGTIVIDPVADPAGAERSLVLGPAPAGYAPLFSSGTGLSVRSVRFQGNLTRSLATTSAAFHRDLLVDTELLAPGVFLGTGSALNAFPPDNATGTTTNMYPPSRTDTLAEVLNRGVWT